MLGTPPYYSALEITAYMFPVFGNSTGGKASKLPVVRIFFYIYFLNSRKKKMCDLHSHYVRLLGIPYRFRSDTVRCS